MGVSFKVSRTGRRFRPTPLLKPDAPISEAADDNSANKVQAEAIERGEDIGGISYSYLSDNEVSFTLNLFPDGYSIGKAFENEIVHQSPAPDVPKSLHPYDRASEALFSAIESGRLPSNMKDDIPCKYVNGTLVCEIRDYRNCTSEQGIRTSRNECPAVNKVCLRMSLENVVKDIPLISDNSWTYGDLMEVESRIVNALQPQLCLDPTPKLDRLCANPLPEKLNLDLCSIRKRRLKQMPEITVTSNDNLHGKKVRIERVLESSDTRVGDSGPPMSGDLALPRVDSNMTLQNVGPSNLLATRPRSIMPDAPTSALPPASKQSNYEMTAASPRVMQDHGQAHFLAGASTGQDLLSYVENSSASPLHGKRENQDGQFSPLSSFGKRARLTPGPDSIQQQQAGSHVDGIQWKHALLQQQPNTRGSQYTNSLNRFSPQMLDGILNQEAGMASFGAGQQGLRYVQRDECLGTDKLDTCEFNRNQNMQMLEMEANRLNQEHSRFQQRLPHHAFMRPNLPQASWNNIIQQVEKDFRKEDQLQKRKPVQSPRISTGTLPHSPLSSKSGELSTSSFGTHFGGVATSAANGSSQKEKPAVISPPSVGGTPSLTSSANNTTQRQQHAQNTTKRKSSSLPKAPAMSGIGSPASVGNTSLPLPPVADQSILDKFSKIEMVCTRHRLNCKQNRVKDYPMRKSNMHSPQEISVSLSNISNNEDFKDDKWPLSKSILGGGVNVSKIRILNFVQPDQIVQGNIVSVISKSRTRLIMSEKPNDGTVAMHCGEIDDSDFLSAEDYLPILPNSHSADLLALQFCSLMIREGYLVEDQNIPKPSRINLPQSNQSGAPLSQPNTSSSEMRQSGEAGYTHSSYEGKSTLTSNIPQIPPQNHLPNTRMLSPGNSQASSMSQALMHGVPMAARSQLLDSQQPSLHQPPRQQNQHPLIQQKPPHFQKSPLMPAANPLNTIGQNSNMQLGNHMLNKPSPFQLQLMQQQQHNQQQLQNSQMQRKMMMGLGTIGNMGNNLAGLGGLGGVMGMGVSRGIGGTVVSSSPVGSMPLSGMGNVSQTPMNLNQNSNISNAISQQFQAGALNPAQAALMATKIRMMQNRASLLGGQSSMAGMPGIRSGPAGLSMLGSTLNRANISSVGPMAPPKLMSGMNIYANQQQLQLQQLQRHQLQQQGSPAGAETSSPLLAVVSSSQVGSPSAMGVAQQLNQQPQPQLQHPSPQQMIQRSPMSPQQMSSGAIHGMSVGNLEACPASPQLSSQTLCSVGSITNSPLELQGVNQSNNVSNA